MNAATPAQVRQWSEQVARDPGSLFFLPLADVYRASGHHQAALRLCLRGLERHPNHVGAHYLLGLLYRESGDPVRAFDEWDIALRLDPEHEGARREMERLRAEREDPSQPPSPPAPPPGAGEGGGEARERFRMMVGEPGILGAVLLDEQGLVLAGEIRGGEGDRATEVAAALRGVSEDAEHAVRHLDMGRWNAILLETPGTIVHVAPVADAVLAVAATRELPLGWTVRLASRIRGAAAELLDSRVGDGG